MGDSAAMSALRFAFVTQDDPFYVRIFFEEFFGRCEDRTEVQVVVIAPAMGKRRLPALVRQMYQFYGLANFLRVGTKYVLYKLGAIAPAWMRGRRFFSVEQVCNHYGVDVLHVEDINSREFHGAVRAWNLDLIISVAAPQIFQPGLIGVPRKGCINIHNSKLPKYRGMLPNFWQMYHGERAVGTTIHWINADIDDGDILLQAETPMAPGETLDSLIARTKRLGAGLMVEALRQIRSGEAQKTKNNKEDATYYRFPTRADVQEFHRRGYRLL